MNYCRKKLPVVLFREYMDRPFKSDVINELEPESKTEKYRLHLLHESKNRELCSTRDRKLRFSFTRHNFNFGFEQSDGNLSCDVPIRNKTELDHYFDRIITN